MVQVEREGSDSDDDSPQPEKEPEAPKERKVTKPGEPAYVAPIPKIGPISPISPTLGIPVSQTSRPPLPKFVGSFLVGKTVDESGDIVDEKTGQVLARAGGDLPSIVGRRVSNNKGDILGDNGELLGYVADVEIERKGSNAGSTPSSSPGWPPMRSLAEMMARSNASLMVDHLGNILDTNGNVVGKFHDNNNPAHRKEREEQQRAKEAADKAAADNAAAAEAAEKAARSEEPPKPAPADAEDAEREQKRQPRSDDERRRNAQDWRKEGESPSDIFLDVKSTTEGIQLTIRIPTVFNGTQVRPTVQFS